MNTEGQLQGPHAFYSSLQPSPHKQLIPSPTQGPEYLSQNETLHLSSRTLGPPLSALPIHGSHYSLKPPGISASLKPKSSDSDRIRLAIPVLLHPRRVILDELFTLLELQPINLLTEQRGLEPEGQLPVKCLLSMFKRSWVQSVEQNQTKHQSDSVDVL